MDQEGESDKTHAAASSGVEPYEVSSDANVDSSSLKSSQSDPCSQTLNNSQVVHSVMSPPFETQQESSQSAADSTVKLADSIVVHSVMDPRDPSLLTRPDKTSAKKSQTRNSREALHGHIVVSQIEVCRESLKKACNKKNRASEHQTNPALDSDLS